MVTKRFELFFPERKIKEPIIWKLGKDFAIVTSIFRAKVTKEIGWIELEIQGSAAEIDRAVADLKSKGITVLLKSKAGV